MDEVTRPSSYLSPLLPKASLRELFKVRREEREVAMETAGGEEEHVQLSQKQIEEVRAQQ